VCSPEVWVGVVQVRGTCHNSSSNKQQYDLSAGAPQCMTSVLVLLNHHCCWQHVISSPLVQLRRRQASRVCSLGHAVQCMGYEGAAGCCLVCTQASLCVWMPLTPEVISSVFGTLSAKLLVVACDSPATPDHRQTHRQHIASSLATTPVTIQMCTAQSQYRNPMLGNLHLAQPGCKVRNSLYHR